MLFILIVSNSSHPVPLETTLVRLLLPCLHPDHHDQGHWWSTHCQIQTSVLKLIIPDLSVEWWDTFESEWGTSNDCIKFVGLNKNSTGQTKTYQHIWNSCSLPSLETSLLLTVRATVTKLSSYLPDCSLSDSASFCPSPSAGLLNSEVPRVQPLDLLSSLLSHIHLTLSMALSTVHMLMTLNFISV